MVKIRGFFFVVIEKERRNLFGFHNSIFNSIHNSKLINKSDLARFHKSEIKSGLFIPIYREKKIAIHSSVHYISDYKI